MTHTQKAIGILVGVILLLVIFSVFFNSPVSRRLGQIQEEAKNLERQIEAARTRLAGLPGIEERISEARRELDRMEVQYPRSVESVYLTITEAARKTGFRISRRDASERPEAEEDLRVFEINIVGYSPYRALGEFLEQVNSSPMLISVSSLTVSSEIPVTVQAESADLRVDMRLTTYLSKNDGG